jgi:hypothetical protein
MTFRSVLIGLIAAMLVAGLDYLSRFAWPLGLSFESHLPISVFALMVILMLTVNPLLSCLGGRLRIKGSEMAVILALALTGCGLANWTHTLTKAITMPVQYNQTDPGWRKAGVLEHVPPAMLPAGGKWQAGVMEGFLTGLGREGQPIHLDRIPWSAWIAPLSVWMPIILLTGLACIGLSLVLHRQWSHHERLRYPIAAFGVSLLADDGRRGLGGVYRDRLFWLGLSIPLFIRMVNYAFAWSPSHMFYIPMQLNFTAILSRFPSFAHVDGYYFLTQPNIIPIAIAFAFFLASDVGFSLGIGYLVFEVAVMILLPFGITAGGRSYVLGGWDSFMRFGGFVGIAGILLYIGRKYYGSILRRSLGLRAGDTVESSAVWGLRLAVVSSAGVSAILMGLGLEWPLAILAVGLLMLIFLVVSRVSAESGLFTFRAAWMPIGPIVGFLGPAVIGPDAFMLLALFSIVISVDTISTLMPYVINSLKMSDEMGLRVGKVGTSLAAGLVLAAAVAVPVCMWTNYNYGLGSRDYWASVRVAKLPFDTGEQVLTRLKLSGQMEAFHDYGPLQRWAHPQPNRRFLVCAALGFGLVILLGALRMRFQWWPLHPILLLTLGSWSIGQFGFSFLLGWAARQAILFLGGGSAVHRARRIMTGVIAGDLVGMAIPTAVRCCYFLLAGQAPMV